MTALPSTTYEPDGKRSLGDAVSSIWRGRLEDPRWERPALILVLALNSALYFWNLGINGWANAYYSAAVQAGATDWKAFFFGSLDWGNAITVDKPPLSLWVMGISARIFGFSPVSIMAPQAAMGVLTTFLIYALLRRNFSAIASLTACVVFFTTPIITLLSRYNNPDPLMLFLMVAAVYLAVLGLEKKSDKALFMAGVLLGLAFMTKQLQALLCVPALGIAILTAGKTSLWHRLRTGTLGLTAMAICGLSWMLLVELIPSDSRPYVGGSPTNSVLQLTLRYNGIDRVISTQEDPTIQLIDEKYRSEESDIGFFRLFNANFGQEASWLLIVALAACLIIAIRWQAVTRTHGRLVTTIVVVGWFLTTYLLLSFMGNGIHTYYSATMVPPLALLIGITVDILVAHRNKASVRITASIVGIMGTVFAAALLNLGAGWPDFLIPGILIAGFAGSVLIAVKPPFNVVDGLAIALLAFALLAGPVLISVFNVLSPHHGSNLLSGPVTKSNVTISHFLAGAEEGKPVWAKELGYGLVPGPNLAARLAQPGPCKWAAATYPGQTAAQFQLAVQKPIMSLSGFMGVDPYPTLERFQREVDSGSICYLVWQQSHLDVPGRSESLVQISDWVRANFPSEEIDGSTVYDLRKTEKTVN
ncbi:ArnT family glycosyltransferase [Arthrobacter sp. AD-310]